MADVSELTFGSIFIGRWMVLHSPAYEDGTESEFRNVGHYNSDAGDLPKKEHITFKTRRKLKNKKMETTL